MEIGPVPGSVGQIAGQPAHEPASQQRELIRAIARVNGAEVFGQDNELLFSVDSESRRPVILVVNRDTREVVGQIPPEYITKLASNLRNAAG